MTKPNNWLTLLQENSTLAIRQIAKIKPAAFEASQEERNTLLSRYDSLKRSLAFFMVGDKKTNLRYSKPDRAANIMHILAEMDDIRNKGLALPEAKTIGQLCKEDTEACEDKIVLILNDLRLFFQVENMIGTSGLYTVASIITAEYRNLCLEELAICMNLAKLGEYGKEGKVYNRLDGAIILGWIKQYMAEKQIRLNNRNYTKDAHTKIGLEEGRTAYMNNSTLLLEAQIALANQKLKTK